MVLIKWRAWKLVGTLLERDSPIALNSIDIISNHQIKELHAWAVSLPEEREYNYSNPLAGGTGPRQTQHTSTTGTVPSYPQLDLADNRENNRKPRYERVSQILKIVSPLTRKPFGHLKGPRSPGSQFNPR